LIVHIDQPTTLLSNLLLSVVTLVLGLRLLRLHGARTWSLAFLCISAGALVAGACHGFSSTIPRGTWWALWRAMLYLTAAGAMLSAVAVGLDPLSGRVGRVLLLSVAIARFLILLTILTHDPDFALLMRDAAALSLLMLIVLGVSWYRHRRARSAWVAAGVFVAVSGGALRTLGVSLEPFLNANDLYHVIQVGAFDLIYRGASTPDPAPSSPASV
jgi:hypothetical protein